MSIARNTAAVFAGAVIPMVVVLVTVPASIRVIGMERYGILAVIWALLAMFAQVDIGSRALIQRFASHIGNGESAHARIDLYIASLAINLGLGFSVGGVLWLTFNALARQMTFSDATLEGQFLSSRMIVAAYLPVLSVRALNNSVQIATERFQSASILNASETSASAIAPLGVAALITTDLFWLLGGILVVRIIFLALSTLAILPSLSGLSQGRLRWYYLKDTLHFGLWAVLTGIVGSLFSIGDRFVVGRILGLEAVPFLSVPSNLYNQIAHVPRALGTVLLPRFSAMADAERKVDLAARSIAALTSIMTPLLVIAIISAEPVLRLWISKQFATNAATTATLLFFGLFATAIARVPNSLLMANNRADIPAKALIIEAAPYAILLYTLVVAYGVVGAGWAFLVRSFADYWILAYASGLSRQAIPNVTFGTVQLSTAFAVTSFIPFESPLRWIFSAFVLAVVLVSATLYMPAELVRIVVKVPIIARLPLGIMVSNASGSGKTV